MVSVNDFNPLIVLISVIGLVVGVMLLMDWAEKRKKRK